MNHFKNMKTYTYMLKTLSPIILSPRSSQAFYKDIDYMDSDQISSDYNIIYPFYRYGDYTNFDPKSAEYYIPGSSIKGALTFDLNDEITPLSFFVDDIRITEWGSFEVISLNKSQYFNLPDGKNAIPKIKEFFNGTVGFECLKAGIELSGEVLFVGDFSDFVKNSSIQAKARCQNDIARLERYIENLKIPGDYATNPDSQKAYDSVTAQICEIKCHIEKLCKPDYIMLLGGYKGLIRALNAPEKNTQGTIFATMENNPFGFIEISDIKEVKKNG